MRNHPTFILFVLLAFWGIADPCPVAADDIVTVTVPAVVYFPVLPFEALPDSLPELVPVSSNHPLTGDHVGLTRAIIVIHDTSRDASRALSDMTNLAGASNAQTLIIAPQFLLESDLARFADHLPDDGKNFARWPLGGWEQGSNSIALPQQKGISSFTALDLLLLYLGDHNAFPDLQQIVIAGHGAGADFILRYAAVGRAIDLLHQEHVLVRFVAANASSFLYLTSTRFKGGKQGFGTPDLQQCADYNRWPYGLEVLNEYGHRVGPNEIKLNFPIRHVAYLAGANMTHNDPSPDGSCAALLQGGDRAARMTNYAMYINIIFGDEAAQSQSFKVIPKAGYDAAQIFSSACGTALLFGDGVCKQ